MGLENFCCAVIAAAGASARMKSGDSKQFIKLLDIPSVVYTLRAFEKAESVHSIVIVCRKEDVDRMSSVSAQYHISKVVSIISGAETRQKSVAAGISAIPEETRLIAVHDGARPLIQPEEIDLCVHDAVKTGASALAVPVKDTVKVIDENRMILKTPPRQFLWSVQTPQVFERKTYIRALEQAERDGLDYTDDCQLLEHIHVQVHLCSGNYENIKLTTPEDVLAAEAILRRRGEL